MARAATSPELVLFRTEKKWSKIRAAILDAPVMYTALINQTFSTFDGVLELTYDTGSGTLADVLPDMTLLIGSTAGAHDVGIVRIRSVDGTKFYIGETSDVKFANNQHLTVLADFGLWARHVKLTAGVPFMDGGVAYSNQHTNFDPTPVFGSHRVLKLTGASVSAAFNAAGSYALGSSISAYAWTAPGSSSSSGMTTATPTISWNTVGWKLVYLTLTAANGKSFFGVRYVYVWNDANPPASAVIGDCRSDVESGGWQFDLTLKDNVDLDTVRDHALMILFAEDHYGDTEQSIGPVTGCENIVVTGWIAKESINWNPEQGQVRFTGYTAQFWLSQIPSYPDGVELVTGTPAAWTEIQGLTVNKGLFHFVHWRTTATRVMDVFLTDNTLYTKEVSSLAQNLWEQLREMAFLQVYARPGVNALNQLYIEVHPQLVPEASRTWPTVMTILKGDWKGEIDFERVTMNEAAAVSLSGVAVNESGVGVSYFSLYPGHVYTHYGKPEIQDRLLVESQSQANTLCGMYGAWRNNPYPDIPIVLFANNRLIDCFPRQQCDISIAAGDTPRGIAYSGGLIPTSVAYVPDPETGYLHTEVTFEAETGLAANIVSVTGDVPGSGDISVPPTPSFPSLPPFPVLIPGGGGVGDPSATGPKKVLLPTTDYGLLYSANFADVSPSWITVNAGLTAAEYASINRMFVCPNGAFYVAYCNTTDGGGHPFVARAPSIGGTFVILYDETNIPGTGTRGIWAINYNPLVSESVGIVMGQHGPSGGNTHLYVGAGASFVQGGALNTTFVGSLTYGLGYWMWCVYGVFALFTPSGTAAGGGTLGVATHHIRAGTTGITMHNRNGGNGIYVGQNNLATSTLYNPSPDSLTIADGANPINTAYGACDPTGMFIMTRFGSGARGKSSDGAATWASLGVIPPGNWWWAYAGGVGVASRWIAAGGTACLYSANFGVSWVDKTGTLLTAYPLPNINSVLVVEY